MINFLCRKLTIGIALVVNLSTVTHAQERSGIRFFQGTWKEMLAAAKSRHQPVFVDVYTDWCAPCKRMEQEVFVLPEVGTFYNARFICYRLNAEKDEGPGLAKAYGIGAYPTWLFLDEQGNLRSRKTDYLPAADLIAAGKAALGKESVSDRLAALKLRFDTGERNSAFLRNYLEARTALQLDNAEVMNAYVAGLKNAKPSMEELRFLANNSERTWSAAVPVVAAHLNVFGPAERKQVAGDFFSHTLYAAWGSAVKAGDRPAADQGMMANERLYPLLDEAQQLVSNRILLYHCKAFRLFEGLKKAGYRIAEKQMAVDTLAARRKDKELLNKVMAPFISGQQDSTKIPDFQAEKRMAARQYSGNTATLLYEVADAFDQVLPPNDPARRDAAAWAQRASLLLPNEPTRALAKKLAASKPY